MLEIRRVFDQDNMETKDQLLQLLMYFVRCLKWTSKRENNVFSEYMPVTKVGVNTEENKGWL